MSNVYVIADTHFGHGRILEYEPGPFSCVAQKDAEQIGNWNDAVGDDDVVWHLGDFALTGSDKTKSIISMLRGRKRIICGSHDRSATWYKDHGFEFATKERVVIPIDCVGKDRAGQERIHVVLSHEQADDQWLATWGPLTLNVHGHSHSKVAKWRGNKVCVSVEHIDYTPVLLKDLVIQWATQRAAKSGEGKRLEEGPESPAEGFGFPSNGED
jgi:calcineurin-like phosphoesterase family protein